MASNKAADIELVVTDLDGTLWNANLEVEKNTFDALTELEKAGITVLAATARGPKTTFGTFDQLGISMPAVLCNGAMGRLPDGRSFHQATFSKSAVTEILAMFAEASLVPHIPVDHPDYGAIIPVDASSCATFTEQTRHGGIAAEQTAALDHDVVAFRLLGLDRDRLADVAELCEARDDTRVYFAEDSLYGKWSLQIGPIAANKWAGVLAYCAFAGIDSTAILGVGDDINDVDYLDKARISVAMPGSLPEVLNVVDYALADGEGWSSILRYI